jgi:hypothetical protein
VIGPLEPVALNAQSSVAPPAFKLHPLVPRVGEITVKVAVRPVVTVSVVVLFPENEPVMTTGVDAGTVPVVTVNDALVFPVATVTLGGTITSVGLALDRTTTDGAVAARARVTVP